MTARDDNDEMESNTTDDPTTSDAPTAPGESTSDRLTPMQPRHGPRPRRLT